MLKQFPYIFIFLFICSSFAQDDLDQFLDDPSFSAAEESFSELDLLDTHIKKGNANYHPLPPAKKTITQDKPPVKYRAILRKGSMLTHMKTGKEFFTHKDIYVITRLQYQGSKYSYLFNKKNELVYKTTTNNMTSIENEILLHPKVDASFINPKKTTFTTIDISLNLDNAFGVSYSSFSTPKNLTTIGLEGTGATGTSFEARSVIMSSLPIHFGVEFEYLSAAATNDSGQQLATWNILNLGPIIKYPFMNLEQWKMSTLMSLRRSLFHSMETETNTYNFSSSSWKAQIVGEKKYEYGTLALAMGYFKEKSSLKPSVDDNISITSDKTSTTGLSFSVGYNFELNL